jgi:hypothetical protein
MGVSPRGRPFICTLNGSLYRSHRTEMFHSPKQRNIRIPREVRLLRVPLRRSSLPRSHRGYHLTSSGVSPRGRPFICTLNGSLYRSHRTEMFHSPKQRNIRIPREVSLLRVPLRRSSLPRSRCERNARSNFALDRPRKRVPAESTVTRTEARDSVRHGISHSVSVVITLPVWVCHLGGDRSSVR